MKKPDERRGRGGRGETQSGPQDFGLRWQVGRNTAFEGAGMWLLSTLLVHAKAVSRPTCHRTPQDFVAALRLCVRLKKSGLDFISTEPHHTDMKLILSTHNVTLTKAIEDHVLVRLDKLEHFDRWAVDARVTLEHDHTRSPERQFSCSMRLSVRGPDLFAEDRQSDLYSAIDVVSKKIEQQIRKRHNKTKARKHKVAARTKQRLKDNGL